jgi:hypothetical protein
VTGSNHLAHLIELSRSMLRSWIAYAVAGAVLTVVVALVVSFVGGAQISKAVWLAAAFAYVLQAAAFALLLLVRDHASLFMAGWLGGMVLRFGAVAGLAFWAARFTTFSLPALLLSLVGFVFLLLLLEPVFLRWDLRRS